MLCLAVAAAGGPEGAAGGSGGAGALADGIGGAGGPVAAAGGLGRGGSQLAEGVGNVSQGHAFLSAGQGQEPQPTCDAVICSRSNRRNWGGRLQRRSTSVSRGGLLFGLGQGSQRLIRQRFRQAAGFEQCRQGGAGALVTLSVARSSRYRPASYRLRFRRAFSSRETRIQLCSVKRLQAGQQHLTDRHHHVPDGGLISKLPMQIRRRLLRHPAA